MSTDPKLEHAHMPRICDKCDAAVIKEATHGLDVDHLHYCEHRLAFAIARMRRGIVAQWTITAPVLPEVALGLIKAYAADAAKKGVELRPSRAGVN